MTTTTFVTILQHSSDNYNACHVTTNIHLRQVRHSRQIQHCRQLWHSFLTTTTFIRQLQHFKQWATQDNYNIHLRQLPVQHSGQLRYSRQQYSFQTTTLVKQLRHFSQTTSTLHTLTTTRDIHRQLRRFKIHAAKTPAFNNCSKRNNHNFICLYTIIPGWNFFSLKKIRLMFGGTLSWTAHETQNIDFSIWMYNKPHRLAQPSIPLG